MRNDRIRIVIADDEQNICEMLKRLIRFDDLGLELIGMVSNGEDLRNVIVKEKPDIVILTILQILNLARRQSVHSGQN